MKIRARIASVPTRLRILNAKDNAISRSLLKEYAEWAKETTPYPCGRSKWYLRPE